MKHKFWLITYVVVTLQATAQERVSLEQVIALSLEKNYDVLLAKNSAEVSATDNAYSWGAFLPQVNATGTYGASKTNQRLDFESTSNNRSGPAQSKNYGGSIALTWTLFDGTRMFATRERLEEIARQGELNVKNQIVNTIASVTLSYYDIVRQKQQLKAIQEQMAVGEERVKLAERKLEVGTGGKPELLQAKVDLNTQRTQAIAQESIIKQLKDQLNGMVNMQLPSEFDVADTIAIDLSLQEEDLQRNYEVSNYGLQALGKNLNIASLSLHERRAERLPFINFNAAYIFTHTDNIINLNLYSPLLSQTKGLNNYGLSVTLPILNGFNNRRLVQQAKINFNRQKFLFEQQKLVVSVGIKNALVNYENAKRILLIEEETTSLAKENVFIALEGFKRGITTFIELRTAQQSLEDSYTRLINARYDAKVAETELLRLNGNLLK